MVSSAQVLIVSSSHANIHASARPHHCPVRGCPRSYGGKGFKRKTEVARHRRIHDYAGYVCPFCPDHQHKSPGPDGLLHHVRIHHVDKSSDDPLVRDVLSQRPHFFYFPNRRNGLA
ncbi:hypothetical protein PG993_013535 [Apiospora rasikravindrae]|uniref:C2H2-type domain-containing protein n=1 Tax=Apiospora rasikravindrae TaxID=990691 RepID=A0ABR1RY31_9PEZI